MRRLFAGFLSIVQFAPIVAPSAVLPPVTEIDGVPVKRATVVRPPRAQISNPSPIKADPPPPPPATPRPAPPTPRPALSTPVPRTPVPTPKVAEPAATPLAVTPTDADAVPYIPDSIRYDDKFDDDDQIVLGGSAVGVLLIFWAIVRRARYIREHPYAIHRAALTRLTREESLLWKRFDAFVLRLGIRFIQRRNELGILLLRTLPWDSAERQALRIEVENIRLAARALNNDLMAAEAQVNRTILSARQDELELAEQRITELTSRQERELALAKTTDPKRADDYANVDRLTSEVAELAKQIRDGENQLRTVGDDFAPAFAYLRSEGPWREVVRRNPYGFPVLTLDVMHMLQVELAAKQIARDQARARLQAAERKSAVLLGGVQTNARLPVLAALVEDAERAYEIAVRSLDEATTQARDNLEAGFARETATLEKQLQTLRQTHAEKTAQLALLSAELKPNVKSLIAKQRQAMDDLRAELEKRALALIRDPAVRLAPDIARISPAQAALAEAKTEGIANAQIQIANVYRREREARVSAIRKLCVTLAARVLGKPDELEAFGEFFALADVSVEKVSDTFYQLATLEGDRAQIYEWRRRVRVALERGQIPLGRLGQARAQFALAQSLAPLLAAAKRLNDFDAQKIEDYARTPVTLANFIQTTEKSAPDVSSLVERAQNLAASAYTAEQARRASCRRALTLQSAKID